MPFILVFFFFRVIIGKEDKSRFLEKLGLSSKKRPSGAIIWFHACSVGEVKSSYNLIRNFVRNNYIVLVTTNTYLSSLDVRETFSKNVIHQYLPLDFNFLIRKFLNYWRPSKAIFVESELWPNLIFISKNLKIPLCLIQARISENSLKKWKLLGTFLENILEKFSLIIAVSSLEKEKLEYYTKFNINYVANLKYSSKKLDYSTIEKKKLEGHFFKKKIITSLSTHSGEEEIILKQSYMLKKKNLIIIQPRHPNRNKKIISLLKKYNLNYKQRSKEQLPNKDTNVYLFDTFGDSGLLISISDVIILGGTLVPIGGHNLLESAQFGKSIIVGPYIQKIEEVVKYFEEHNAIETNKNINYLYKNINNILTNEKYSKKLNLNSKKLTLKFSNAETTIYKKIGQLK